MLFRVLICAVFLFRCEFEAWSKYRYHEIKPKKQTHFECLFLGDTYFGETYQQQLHEQYESYLDLSNVDSYLNTAKEFRKLLDTSDLNILNFASVATTLSDSPLKKEGKEWIHKSDIKTIEAFQKLGIHVVSLANNHAMDFGPEGLRETLWKLEAAGIHAVGGGETRENALEPYLFKVPLEGGREFKGAIIGAYELREAYLQEGYDFYARKSSPGVAQLDLQRIRKVVQKIRRADKDTFIILFPHWGRNYSDLSEQISQDAEKLHEMGINVIIGHGAHLAQSIAVKNENLAAFNIGNFIFNSLGGYARNHVQGYSFIVMLIKEATTDDVEFRFYPIFGDNKEINYIPRFVGEGEFKELMTRIKAREIPEGHLKYDRKNRSYLQIKIPVHIGQQVP